MERQLASIQTVHNIQPIDGADRIVTANVLGWQVVTKKGEFEDGDKCVFFEIDSVLPDDNPAFEFLGSKRRLKTIRLRQQLSQGLSMPLDAVFAHTGYPESYDVGDDVTEHLSVTKFDPTANEPFYKRLGNSRVRTFPSFIPRTDEPRLQSSPQLLEEIKDIPLYITSKLDGTSMTAYHFNGEVAVCSRQMTISLEDGNVYAEAFNDLDLGAKLPAMGNYAIQGELVGPKIQGNKLGLDKRKFFAFNVYDIDTGSYLNFGDFTDFCEELEIQTVPVKFANVILNNCTLESLLDEAKGMYQMDGFVNSSWPREGIVIRPMIEGLSGVLRNRLSFKVINNDFLEKGGN